MIIDKLPSSYGYLPRVAHANPADLGIATRTRALRLLLDESTPYSDAVATAIEEISSGEPLTPDVILTIRAILARGEL